MEKTAKEWFKEISHEPTRLRAIKNIEHKTYTYKSLKNALEGSFYWVDTEGGLLYWVKVSDHFARGLNDPKILSEIENKYLKND